MTKLEYIFAVALIYLLAALIISGGLVFVWHLLAPESWRWL